jgi:hypothetical protein
MWRGPPTRGYEASADSSIDWQNEPKVFQVGATAEQGHSRCAGRLGRTNPMRRGPATWQNKANADRSRQFCRTKTGDNLLSMLIQRDGDVKRYDQSFAWAETFASLEEIYLAIDVTAARII